MDRTAAPWRVLEAPAPSDGGLNAAAPGGVAAATGRDGSSETGVTTVPARWQVAGAGTVVAAVVLAIALAIGATDPAVALPVGSDGSAAAGAGGAASRVEASGSGGTTAGAGAGTAGDGLVVEVAGAVARPGLIHLPAGARVADAITAAGGFGPRVDAARATATLNLAARLTDGDRVVVPSRDDPIAGPSAGGGASAGGSASGGGSGGTSGGSGGTGAPLDLNGATPTELDGLPGIGPVTAAKIVAAREERPFRSVDELRERKLVGPSTFAKLRDLVVVR